jgi:hypothetical protein
MLKIDKHKPIPQSRRIDSTANPIAETAKKIKVGESVFFKDEKDAARFYSTLNRLGRKAIRRKEGNGVRVWRAYGKPNWVKENEAIRARKDS